MPCAQLHPVILSDWAESVELPIQSRWVVWHELSNCERYSKRVSNIGEGITYKCYGGHWITPGKLSSTLYCQNDGEWSPSPDSVTCTRTISVQIVFDRDSNSCQLTEVMCGQPEYIQNAVIRSGGSHVGDVRDIVCDKGFWIDQENAIAHTSITCSADNARWSPEDVKCQGNGRVKCLAWIAAVDGFSWYAPAL